MYDMKISGIFEPKKVLFEDNNISKSVSWEYAGEVVNIHDREQLLLLQTRLMEECDWAGVKLINKIFIELDAYEKNIHLSSYPVNLQIEHTNICNAQCVMCSHCFTKNHNGKNMNDSELAAIKEILPFVEHVTLHGMGEPFAHPQIVDILKMYHSYDIKITCNTNASIMTDALAEMIHKCFYDIAVSCDACTKETYEQIRKGLNFEKFIHNVKLLRSKGNDLYMRLSAVAMRQNLKELPGIVKLADELGFQEVLIVDITTQGLLENEKDCLHLYPAAAQHYLKLAVDEGAQRGIPVKIPDYIMNIIPQRTLEEDMVAINAIPFFKDDSFTENLYARYEEAGFVEPVIEATTDNFVIPSQYKCNGICDFVLERPFINANGDVFLCCTNWMHIVGNIYKDGGFDAVWNGKIMCEIRKLFYDGHVPKYCVGCIFLRNEMMCKRIKVENINETFYKHNYDEMVSEILSEYEK